VTGSQRLFGDPVTIARSIKQRIRSELQLTASIGVAFNKFLAKLASDLDKPDGLTIITPDNLDDVLGPLLVTRVWGIGPQAAAQLQEMGVQTIADLRDVPLKQLTRRFGTAGEAFYRLARGQDKRSVTPDHQARSIGQENTFTQDVPDADHVRHVLLGHVEHVARRLRRHGLHARRVTLKIRYGDFETITRAATLDSPTDITDTLWHAAARLFDRWTAASFQPVRLIGMTASDLTATGGQMDLFTDERRHRQQRLDQTTDRIAARFGKQSIHRGAAAKTHPNAQSPRTRG
ncbi:MAG: DNA polymerase IV, partial [Phycisphaeraceae bacterium]